MKKMNHARSKQLRIQQIDAEMERQRQEKVDMYCRRIIEYCDRSITKNR